MTTISILLFLIGLCVITMGYAYVQKMTVKLVSLLAEAPVTSAYVTPVEDHKGTVISKNGLSYIENKRTDVGFSSVHYPDKTIRLAARAAGIHTMFIRPKKSIALSKVVITKQADKTALSIWILKKIAASKAKHEGTAERSRDKPVAAQLSGYRVDGSFRVSIRDRPVMNGPSHPLKISFMKAMSSRQQCINGS